MKSPFAITLLCGLLFFLNITEAAIPIKTNQKTKAVTSIQATDDLVKKQKPSLIHRVLNRVVGLREADEKPKMVGTDGFAVASFLASILGIFVAGILLGAIGFAFGLTALRRIGDGSQRGGRGLAIAGMIIGLIAFFGAIIVLGSL